MTKYNLLSRMEPRVGPYKNICQAGPVAVLLLLCVFITGGCSNEKVKPVSVSFSDEGIIVYRLGTDTIGYQYFRIRNDSISLRSIYFPGGYRYTLTDAVLNDTGKIIAAHIVEMKNNNSGVLTESRQSDLGIAGSMSLLSASAGTGGKAVTTGFAGAAFAISDAGPATEYFFPALARYATGNDSVKGLQLAFTKTRNFWMRRVTDNLVYAGGDIVGKVKMKVDSADRLVLLDATESPLRTKGFVFRNWDFDSLMAATRARADLASMPPLSPVSKQIYHYPELDVMLNYSMPSKRGRKIFGRLVSYEEIWRMGANRATEISFSEPVYFGQRKIMPGTYSLFAIVAPTSAMLLMNDKSNIWGTDHEYQWDGVRTPFTIATLGEPREQLKIEVLRTGPGRYRLQFEWDTMRAYVDFASAAFTNPADEEDGYDDPDDNA